MDNLKIELSLSRVEKYPAKQHVQRVVRKLGVRTGLIYLLGQYDFNVEDSDQPKTWHQRRYFYYCSGVDVPNCCLTYDIQGEELVLYIPDIEWDKVVWQGRGPTIKEAEEQYDIDIARHNSVLFSDLRRWMRVNPASTVYILHRDHRPQIDITSALDVEKLQPAIDDCRVLKDHYEIERMRRANQISAVAHRAVLMNLLRFTNETQAHGVFTDACISQFAKKQAYSAIVGSGENASILHYTSNDEPLVGRQLICMDAGAEFENYASDVTRTFPISGSWPSEEARSIYYLVKEMQDTCIRMLRPGIPMIDLHKASHRIAIRGLLALGILRNGTEDEIYEAGTSRGFYPHGLGHHMGLDVHDVNAIPAMRYNAGREHSCPVLDPQAARAPCLPEQPPLEEGMVVTVEPGIYFNRSELNRAYLHDPQHSRFIDKAVLERYWAVGGVRIEDDLVITADGYENLSTAPKVEEAMEIIRQGNGCP